jgi:hypothetical protein
MFGLLDQMPWKKGDYVQKQSMYNTLYCLDNKQD